MKALLAKLSTLLGLGGPPAPTDNTAATLTALNVPLVYSGAVGCPILYRHK